MWLQVSLLASVSGHKARKKNESLKRNFCELYLHLVKLQNFKQLNHTGFRKILKKYDKLARRSHGKNVFNNDVCSAYFWTSKAVAEMLEQVEKVMIQSLERGDRTKAMNRLRVPPLGSEHKYSHWSSYFAGLFCGILLLSAIVACIAFSRWPEGFIDGPDMEPSLRGMRAGLLVSIWFFGFAINSYGWRRARVNNVLIFEFDPRNHFSFMALLAVCMQPMCIYAHNITHMYLYNIAMLQRVSVLVHVAYFIHVAKRHPSHLGHLLLGLTTCMSIPSKKFVCLSYTQVSVECCNSPLHMVSRLQVWSP